jgi:hypothetical protein
MLKDFKKLANKLTVTFSSIKYWPELEFNELDKEKISSIANVTFVNDHSIQLNIDGGNHTILPSQYILYAVCVKELALNTKDYINVFEEKKSKSNQNQIGQQIINKTLDYNDLNIDTYSKIIGPKIFTDETLNLGAKDIVNGKEGAYKLRGIVDFFGSIILKPINIPNASSSILGKFIYNLTENTEIYNYLENRFLDKLPFIVKEKVLKNFCYHVISFLYNYDNLKRLQNVIIKNSDSKFTSIKDENISLTSIFKTSTDILKPEDLIQGDSIRNFEEPLFMLNQEYYYLSTEWTNNGKGRLDLQSFILLVNEYYPEFKIFTEDEYFIFGSSIDNLDFYDTNTSILPKNVNTIYYGAPGTGKSHKVDKIIKDLETKYYERVTFHPEFDNASFIGGYKPISVKEDNGDENIKYQFVPQAFTNIYKRAWQDLDNQYYLVIEEINRGNCAEIFGEIFQLLDRTSNYTVSPSKELKEHLENNSFKDANHLGIVNGLKLPPNLSILATMNTSDQSLFPMDSAFKRRWDWEYIPICYTPIDDFKKKNDSFDFEIDIEDGNKYNWIKFIEAVNLNHIKNNPSLGMDKCIGNYFIKPDKANTISLKPFINKVIFYLWNDVFKDEENKVFEENTSYEDFFPIQTKGKEKIKELFERIDLKKITNPKIYQEETVLDMAAEPELQSE